MQVAIDCPDCGYEAAVRIVWEEDRSVGIMGAWVCDDVIVPCRCDIGDKYCEHSFQLGQAYAEEFDGDA